MNGQTYVLGAGSALIDLLVNVDDAFLKSINAEKGGTVISEIAEINRIIALCGAEPRAVPGGSAGNTIFGLAELGMATSFIGKIGRDREGAIFRDSLLALGARDAFRYADTVNTGCCLSLITPDSERTMRSNFGASLLLSEADLTADDFRGARHFHVEGYQLFMPGLVERMAELAEAAACTMSIDLCAFEIIRAMRKRLAALLPRFDIVFVNENEAAELCGPGSPEEWAERLCEIVPVACLKLGVEGSIVRTRAGTMDRVEARVVPAIDTTGAGDLWASGFLYGYLNGYSMAESASFGSVVAAEVVKVIGPKIPAERWPVIKMQMGIQGV